MGVNSFPSNSNVIIEVVGNYLDEFIIQKTSVLSIAAASTSVQQEYFQKDLIEKFVSNRNISNFSYNFVNKVNQKRFKNKQAFNLIFVDGSSSFA